MIISRDELSLLMRPLTGLEVARADFLDYGVCTSPRSIFDGKVVSSRSGCAAFVEDNS